MIHFEVDTQDAAWETLWPQLSSLSQKLALETLTFCHVPVAGIDVEVILCNDAQITPFNAQYRQKERPTNVLSFPQFSTLDDILSHKIRPLCLGSIIMSHETLAREAADQGKSLCHHGAHLFLHSFLHLLGYDHLTAENAAQMEKIEIDLLAQHNILNPYIIKETL